MLESASAGDAALRHSAQPRGGRRRDGRRVQSAREAVLAIEGPRAGGRGELGHADGAGREEEPHRVLAVRRGVHAEPQQSGGRGVSGEDQRRQGAAGVRHEVEAVRGSHSGGHEAEGRRHVDEGDR